jgi:hypothetical protein
MVPFELKDGFVLGAPTSLTVIPEALFLFPEKEKVEGE